MTNSIGNEELKVLLTAGEVVDPTAAVTERAGELAIELSRTRALRGRDFGETPPATAFAAGWEQ